MYRLVTDYLNESANSYPKKIAFMDIKKEITFSELKNSSQTLATELIRSNIFKKPVMVYLEKGVDVIISFMGIAYSGNFYTPIDVTMPVERIEKIAETLNPEVIITDKKNLKKIENLFYDIKTIIIDELNKDVIDIELINKTLDNIIDTDLLYVFFTSGSTGTPKGVSICHRAVIDYTEWVTQTFNIDSSTVFGEQAPFYFDNSILDIFQTLKNGSKCCIIPYTFFMFPKNLFDFMNKNQINTIFWVPSALCLLANLNVLNSIKAKYLKKILFCGEVMPNKQLNQWRKCYPDALFANLYGPTEITDVCSCYIVDREFKDDESLPIGFACKNTCIYVLDDNDELIEQKNIDRRGELCVRGSCISSGYYNNQEKTSTVFVQNPLNKSYNELIYRTGDIVHYNQFGELVYDCRKDYQIKHMGHRIELGEIETAAASIDGVNQCCCIYQAEKQEIVLFYSGIISEKDITENLHSKIPGYMIPQKLKMLKSLPLNINGKIDRNSLQSLIYRF